MRRRKSLLVAGLLLLLILFIAWQAPAGWALKLIRAGHPGLSWSYAHGSAWSGTAENVQWQGLALGRVEWRMLSLEAVAGPTTRWQVNGESTQYRLDGQVIASGSELRTLNQLRASVPAAWVDLSHAVPFVYLTGTLDFDLDAVNMRSGLPVGGSGTIRWTDAGLGGLVNEPLGDIEFLIRPAGDTHDGGIRFDIRTLKMADILVGGGGSLHGADYEIDLALEVADHRADLHELLDTLGESEHSGAIRLRWRGKLFP